MGDFGKIGQEDIGLAEVGVHQKVGVEEVVVEEIGFWEVDLEKVALGKMTYESRVCGSSFLPTVDLLARSVPATNVFGPVRPAQKRRPS